MFGEPAAALSESVIEHQILHLLHYAKIMARKTTSGGFFDGVRMKKHRSPFVRNGVSDIEALVKKKDLFGALIGCDHYAIEVKTKKEHDYIIKYYEELKKYYGRDKKKTHLRNQIEYIEDVNTNGGIGFFASSMEHVAERMGIKYK